MNQLETFCWREAAQDVNNVKIIVKRGKLEINAEKKNLFSKIAVYLPASDIHSLIVNGDAKIFSSGNIMTTKLEITLNGLSQVNIFYHGKLKITPGEGYEFEDISTATKKKILDNEPSQLR